MRIIKTRITSITLAAAAILLSLAVATPAHAAASDCPSGSACIWREASYVTGSSGTNYLSFSQYQANYVSVQYRDRVSGNDTADSVYNNGNYESTRWYEHWFHGGSYFTLPRKVGDSDLNNTTGAVASNWHDRISSAYFASFWP